jgi:hypothetical protein
VTSFADYVLVAIAVGVWLAPIPVSRAADALERIAKALEEKNREKL